MFLLRGLLNWNESLGNLWCLGYLSLHILRMSASFSCLSGMEELIHCHLLVIPEFLLEFIILLSEMIKLLSHRVYKHLVVHTIIICRHVHSCKSKVLIPTPLYLVHCIGIAICLITILFDLLIICPSVLRIVIRNFLRANLTSIIIKKF